MLWFYKLSNFNILLLPTAGWYNREKGNCSSENSSCNPAAGVAITMPGTCLCMANYKYMKTKRNFDGTLR